MAWWIWILIGVALLAVEMASTTMHIGLFAVGALVVAILVGLGVDIPLWGQLVIFTVVSVVSLLFIRPWIVRKLKLMTETKVIDSLVGEQAVALDEIHPAGMGKAEMRGSTWSARNIGETALARGQRCIVAAVDGLVIHVRAS
jgi:membrane protein implicated in regulation of membrane protease activity